MSQTQILVAISILVVVEINHLKWIWWTQWQCRACGTKNRDCLQRQVEVDGLVLSSG